MTSIQLETTYLISFADQTVQIECPTCGGEGVIEYEKPCYRGFNDDVGGIEISEGDCEECGGTGWIEQEEEEGD